MNVCGMSMLDARVASGWITDRIRKYAHAPELVFPAAWVPSTGLSAVGDNGLIAVAMLYLERSTTVAVCGWVATNPANTITESDEAVRTLMREMPSYARRFGATYLLTTFGNRGINRILDELGYITGENAENKFKILEV